jgi:hypothetical protein
MHTLVVTMTTDPNRTSEVSIHLQNDVTAWAKMQPGFVSGEWLISDHREAAMGVVLFDTVDAANRAAAGPRRFVHDANRAWNITTVTVYDPVASARH